MSGVALGVAVIGGGAAITAAVIGANAAKKASRAQQKAAGAGIDVQQEQFNRIQHLLRPFVGAGQRALRDQQKMLANQPQTEAQMVGDVQGSPLFQALNRQGSEAILQNASATGGLRGGNVQGALAQFSPALLNQQILQRFAQQQQRFQNLGSLSGMGANAAAGLGSFGAQNANAIAELLGQQGAAQAGGILGQAGVTTRLLGDLSKVGGSIAGYNTMGSGGASTPAAAPTFTPQQIAAAAQSADYQAEMGLAHQPGYFSSPYTPY